MRSRQPWPWSTCSNLAGRIVTADELHCHHRMTDAIMRQGGDYTNGPHN